MHIYIKNDLLNKKFIKLVDDEFSFFKTDKTNKPDIIIKIKKLKNPDISENFKGIFKFKLSFNKLNKKSTEIYFDPFYFLNNHYVNYVFLYRHIILPLLRFKLTQKGYLMLHSSSFGIKNKGIFISSKSGCGKTALLLDAIHRNAEFLSDEYSIIGHKKILSFPINVQIFPHNLKFGKLSKKISYKQKLQLYFLNLFNLPLSINALSLQKEIKKEKTANLGIILKCGDDKFKIKRLEFPEKAKKLIEINKSEKQKFFGYLDKKTMISHWKKLEKNIHTYMPYTNFF